MPPLLRLITRFHLLPCLLLLCYLLLSGPVSANTTLAQADTTETLKPSRPVIHFYCILEQDTEIFKAYEDLYRHVFNQLNYDFIMSHAPSLRGISELNRGKADGDCGRSAQPIKTPHYENLIRVKTAIARSELSLWSRKPQSVPLTPDALLTTDYKIGVVRGSAAAKRFIHLQQLKVIELTSATIGLKMLHAGRLDLFIADTVVIPTILKQEPSLPTPHKALILEQGYMYPYLFETHDKITADLARVLKLTLADPSHPIHQYSNLAPLP